MQTRPSYLNLLQTGELEERMNIALDSLADCRLCPRQCGVNRIEGELGVCSTGRLAQVASYNLHFGEEAPLVGEGGSGTIFFGRCNLGCVFCQNWDISTPDEDMEEGEAEQLAEVMLILQRQGAHNINFVTPSHVVPQILEGVLAAARRGLELPLVYNSSGYDSVDTLRLLDGVVDIYMPDAKFWDPEAATRYCNAPDYPERAREALREMHRQVGDLALDERGVAERGLLVRHLVMPQGLAGTLEWMRFIASELSPDTYVNVMDQYRPCGKAEEDEEIAVRPTREECEAAVRQAREAGITRLDDRSMRHAQVLFERLARYMNDE